jgi:hypothetical protein
MAFLFREVTVSGGNQALEGTSGVVNAITDFLTDIGFSIEDDRRSQPGNANDTLTHKVVFNSNGGETGLRPNWYLQVSSGTAAAVNANNIGFNASTAYDVGTHNVPASGIEVATGALSTWRSLVTDSDGYNAMFMAGDKDGFVLVLNQNGDITQVANMGRVNTFLDEDLEPYGLLCRTSTTTAINTTDARGIVGNNPPQPLTTAQDASIGVYALAVANEPRINLGNAEALFTALPYVWLVNDASPVRKGAIGYIPHVFAGASDTAGVPFIGKAVVSGTGQEFRVFSNISTSLYLRAS